MIIFVNIGTCIIVRRVTPRTVQGIIDSRTPYLTDYHVDLHYL